MIEIISATRLPEAEFCDRAALGISLRRLAHDTRLVARVTFSNQRGLPELFNARISARDSLELLVFVHDDVWIDDHFLADRIVEGLRKYDVIGVVGNRRRVRYQPAWCVSDTKFTWDDKANLSGSIAHGAQPFAPVSFYGQRRPTASSWTACSSPPGSRLCCITESFSIRASSFISTIWISAAAQGSAGCAWAPGRSASRTRAAAVTAPRNGGKSTSISRSGPNRPPCSDGC
jgi:hypothetical protein